MALCKLCKKERAVAPDRNLWSMRIVVCRRCHAKRLRQDMERVRRGAAKGGG